MHEGRELSNILKLVRIGFLPPNFKDEDLKKTLYYKIWEAFRENCQYNRIEQRNGKPIILCKKLNGECDFNSCPILDKAIQNYEKATRSF